MIMIMIVVNTCLALTMCQAQSEALCSDKLTESWRHSPFEPAIFPASGGLAHRPPQRQARLLVGSQRGKVETLWDFLSGEGSVHRAFFPPPNMELQVKGTHRVCIS